jgi:hypothetical protein
MLLFKLAVFFLRTVTPISVGFVSQGEARCHEPLIVSGGLTSEAMSPNDTGVRRTEGGGEQRSHAKK